MKIFFPLYGGWLDSICGLMHFTSDDNTLVCGFLCLTKEETCANRYRFEFFGKPEFIFFRPHQVAPVRRGNFVLWPCEPRNLTESEFLEQALWVNNVHRVIPSLSAASYIRLDDEIVLIGSPAHKYVTMVNVGLLNTVSDPVPTDKTVKEVAFSLEGDSIYSISENFCASYKRSQETEVTVWKMSSRKEMMKKTFSDFVSLIPTKEGVLIVTKYEAAELWNFELSDIIRNLPELYGAEFQCLTAISDELIACWKECRYHSFPEMPVDDSPEVNISPELPDSAKPDDSPELNVSTELLDLAKQNDSEEVNVSTELPDSAKPDDSPELNVSTESLDLAKLNDSEEVNV